MPNANDPRSDRHPESGTPGPYTSEQPKQAPGGLGTDTKNAPDKNPAAQPKKQ